ncbi:structural protein [Yersinia phage YerA41]|uniref:Structural protein n=1 Tax=Yersinia phage vB_Yru_GN1 TaxID=3074381 RepID=A0AA86J451_9CAUD|nr:structural protein [Yersinia phage YerA41]BES79803.1 structural protein [Yersinia phage vB_Yru_GN1]
MDSSEAIFSKKLDNGYTVSIQLFTESNGPLAVRLDNSDGEFVGQIFSSFDSYADNVKRFSNKTYELSGDEMKEINDKILAKFPSIKNESARSINRAYNKKEIVNRKLMQFVTE